MANRGQPTAPAARFAVLLAVISAVGCVGGCKTGIRSGKQSKLLLGTDGVPIIRILLTRSAVNQADFSAGRGFQIRADDRVVVPGRSGAAPVSRIRRGGGLWQVGNTTFRTARVVLEPIDARDDRYVGFNGTTYRGKLHLLPRGDSAFVVVNHVNIEDYLKGVLAKELFPSWHIEAYRALAVSARTFAMYHMLTSGQGKDYDMGDTIASQVYGGRTGETPTSRRAVATTPGWILTVKQKGKDRIFMPQYSSCCGGWVNGAVVLRNAPDIKPLRGGQKDDHCTASSRYRWPTVRVSKDELYTFLCRSRPAVKSLGALATVKVVWQLVHGRPVWVDVVGVNGKTVRLRAETIRLALLFGGSPVGKKLYSMNCSIVDAGAFIEFRDGRGFGHGVGMCQFGAQGKALAGWKGEQIFSFYYPGATLVQGY